ncbi:MAG: hypothetical protein ACPG5T_04775, partial [Endozoicomonas sp.]
SIGGFDTAIGNRLCVALSDLAPPAADKSLIEFTGRAPNNQVYYGEFDSPADFLRAFRRAKAKEETRDGKFFNLANLPLVYFYRPPGMALADPGQSPATYGAQFVGTGKDQGTKLVVDVVPVTLEYRVVVAAWNLPVLERLVANLMISLADYTNNRHRLTAAVTERGASFDLDGHLINGRSLEFSNLSSPRGEGRLFAAEASLSVAAELLRVREEQHIEMRYVLERPWVMNCGR